MPTSSRLLTALAAASLLAPLACAESWERLSARTDLVPKKGDACGLAKLPERLQAYQGSKVTWTLSSECGDDLWVVVGNFAPSDDPACRPEAKTPLPIGRDCQPTQVRAGKPATLTCAVDEKAPVGCWRYDVMQADPEKPGDRSRWKVIADPELEIRKKGGN